MPIKSVVRMRVELTTFVFWFRQTDYSPTRCRCATLTNYCVYLEHLAAPTVTKACCLIAVKYLFPRLKGKSALCRGSVPQDVLKTPAATPRLERPPGKTWYNRKSKSNVSLYHRNYLRQFRSVVRIGSVPGLCYFLCKAVRVIAELQRL